MSSPQNLGVPLTGFHKPIKCSRRIPESEFVKQVVDIGETQKALRFSASFYLLYFKTQDNGG